MLAMPGEVSLSGHRESVKIRRSSDWNEHKHARVDPEDLKTDCETFCLRQLTLEPGSCPARRVFPAADEVRGETTPEFGGMFAGNLLCLVWRPSHILGATKNDEVVTLLKHY